MVREGAWLGGGLPARRLSAAMGRARCRRIARGSGAVRRAQAHARCQHARRPGGSRVPAPPCSGPIGPRLPVVTASGFPRRGPMGVRALCDWRAGPALATAPMGACRVPAGVGPDGGAAAAGLLRAPSRAEPSRVQPSPAERCPQSMARLPGRALPWLLLFSFLPSAGTCGTVRGGGGSLGAPCVGRDADGAGPAGRSGRCVGASPEPCPGPCLSRPPTPGAGSHRGFVSRAGGGDVGGRGQRVDEDRHREAWSAHGDRPEQVSGRGRVPGGSGLSCSPPPVPGAGGGGGWPGQAGPVPLLPEEGSHSPTQACDSVLARVGATGHSLGHFVNSPLRCSGALRVPFHMVKDALWCRPKRTPSPLILSSPKGAQSQVCFAAAVQSPHL